MQLLIIGAALWLAWTLLRKRIAQPASEPGRSPSILFDPLGGRAMRTDITPGAIDAPPPVFHPEPLRVEGSWSDGARAGIEPPPAVYDIPTNTTGPTIGDDDVIEPDWAQ